MSSTDVIKNRSQNYWQNKVQAWINESPIKSFDEAVRNSLSDIDSTVNKELVEISNQIASGLTRTALPSEDGNNGSNIKLTHPLVNDKTLEIKINEDCSDDIRKLLETDLSYLLKDSNCSKEDKAKKIFNYLFFAFNKKLRINDIGKLGAFWDVIPADTRIPDHSIWHHFGMTSAIYSSLERNEDFSKENLSIVVYSISPIQPFIMKARKLRDYWTGSVILSYLAFMGITEVIEQLGPDHIVYPSLQNQALMEEWLSSVDELKNALLEKEESCLSRLNKDSKSIPSFPNKFVFICNNKDVKDVCLAIQKKIDDTWKDTAKIVKEYIAKKTGSENNERFNSIWDNAIDKYWKYSWAATNFATINNSADLEKLLPELKWKYESEVMNIFNEEFKKKTSSNYDASNLYGTTHSLVQGILAAGKSKPIFQEIHNPQNGEKCPLCGENEVLNNCVLPEKGKAKEYSENVKNFWENLSSGENDKQIGTEEGHEERLCAVCALKRFLPLQNVWEKDKNILLYKTLVEPYKKENFPSTTEMSAWEFLQNFDKEERKKIADKLHEHEFDISDDYLSNDEKLKEIFKKAKDYETKYYAFLLMDGDKMGDLINGEKIEATWKDVLNVKDIEVLEPFKTKVNEGKESKKLSECRRTINPALHAMVSDALNNFARYGVQPCVNDIGQGKLIYAGGDDVCAILPLSNAIDTANKIRQIYQLSYAQVTEEGSKALMKGEQSGINENVSAKYDMEKIVVHLGHSNKQDTTTISLSGAIIIAHHKQPLKEVIQDAHHVLDSVAKDKSGRNSLAIRLKKRSGGDRDTFFKWEEMNVFAENKTCRESFNDVIKNAGSKLSSSLLYKIENLKDTFEPLLFDYDNSEKKLKPKNIDGSTKELIIQLFDYEVAHSIFKKENDSRKLAEDLAGICIKVKKDGEKIFASDKGWFNPEAAIIANFISQKKPSEKADMKGEENE